MFTSLFHRLGLLAVLGGAALLLPAQTTTPAAAPARTFDVPSGEAAKTLKVFAQQAGREVMFPDVKGVQTNAVQGTYPIAAAMERLLAGTGLVWVEEQSGGLVIRKSPADESKNAPSRPAADRAARDTENGVLKLETFEVFGQKSLNMDIRRTRDDAQPYVIFDREGIEKSGATNINDFLKQRLTMNTQSAGGEQGPGITPGLSVVNLRGLGTEQTLILLDGHRISSPYLQNAVGQSGINGIPLSAVERIEVLPTTASGIYGGSATGGVINVILRRDYAGAELKLTYQNPFESDAALRSVDLSAGFTLEKGKTRVLLAATWAEKNGMVMNDRDFYRDGQATVLRNNPAAILNDARPPFANTSNIRSTTGANLTLKPAFGGANLGSAITFVPMGYQGAASDNGAALVANAGRYNMTPPTSTQPGGGEMLIKDSKAQSAMMTVRRQFGSKVQAFLDLSAANNSTGGPRSYYSFGRSNVTVPVTAPTNPFNQAVAVTFTTDDGDFRLESSHQDRRVLAGVIVLLPRDWKMEADYTWNQSRVSYITVSSISTQLAADVTSGVLDVLRDTSTADFARYLLAPDTLQPQRTQLYDATVRLSGHPFSLPGGQVTASALVEHREQDFGSTLSGPGVVYTPRNQVVDSAYLELGVPVIGAANAKPYLHSLDLQLSGRLDEYATRTSPVTAPVGSTPPTVTGRTRSIDPTLALRFQPTPDVMMRVSYGTGFLPPSLNQLFPDSEPVLTAVTGNPTDPRRGNTPVSANILSYRGGSPNLRPEKSKSWSAGVVITPRPLPGLRLAVDWTKIVKTDNIASPTTTLGGYQAYINLESLFPERFIRGPVTPGDPYGVGPITAIDERLINLSHAEVEAFDAALDYTIRDHGWGTWSLYANATWQTHFKTQAHDTLPEVENLGLGNRNPVRFKAAGGVTWEKGPLAIYWNARYIGRYEVRNIVTTVEAAVLSQGSPYVASQHYHDLSVRYRFNHGRGHGFAASFLRNTELTVGVRNIFNTKPPLDVGFRPTNTLYYYSPYGSPELATYLLSVKKTF